MDNCVKVQRKIIEWEWHDDPNMVSVWLHLLILANSEPKKWHGIVVDRGQVVLCREKFSEFVGISEQKLRTCVSRMVDSKLISKKSTNKYTIVTISNYDRYQLENDALQPTNNQQTTNKQPTDNQQTTNKTETKKKRKIFSPPTLQEVREFAFFQGYDPNEFNPEEFIDFYASKGWMVGKNKMTDWKAALRRWVRTNKEKNGNINNDNRQGKQSAQPDYTGLFDDIGQYDGKI